MSVGVGGLGADAPKTRLASGGAGAAGARAVRAKAGGLRL